MAFGLLPEGFVPKPLEDIKTDLEAGFRAVFGNAISVIPQSVFGLIIGIVAERLSDLWQLGLSIYSSSYRDGASGTNLDNIGALTGTLREAATFTEVTATLTGTPSTVVPAGSVVEVATVGSRFVLDANATIGGGGTVSATFTAEESGPVTAYAGTLTVIATPVAGWSSVTNAADHTTLGTDVETDAAYRLRQVAELRGQGKSTIAALRALIREVDGVSDVYIYENEGDSTDGDGLPPHSFEAVVDGGTDADVASAIILNKPVGIATHGTTTESVDDGQGNLKDVNFSRPSARSIWCVVNLIVKGDTYPLSTGDALVKQAIVDYGDLTYSVGAEVYPRDPALAAAINDAAPGIYSATVLVGLSSGTEADATITQNNRQRAEMDTARITVNRTVL